MALNSWKPKTLQNQKHPKSNPKYQPKNGLLQNLNQLEEHSRYHHMTLKKMVCFKRQRARFCRGNRWDYRKNMKKNNPSFHLSGSSYFTRFHWYGLLIVVVLKFGHPNAQFSPKDNDGYFASPGLVSEELLGGAIVAIRVDLQPHQSSGASWPRHALWPKPGSLGPEMRLVSKWFPLISRSSKI